MTGNHAEIAAAIRAAWPRVIASLTRHHGDWQHCEDAVQDASLAALSVWTTDGVPVSPEAWLLTTARRKLIDNARSLTRSEQRTLAHVRHHEPFLDTAPRESELLGDEPLGLIFLCCHPALSLEARVALTLRSVGGLTTAEIAAGFTTSEATISQRLVRAKAKIRSNGLRFELDPSVDLTERLTAVHAVLYLIFNEGYAASHGVEPLRVSLCDEAIRLTMLLHDMLPDHAETRGLLALMQLHHARRSTRQRGGRPTKLADQDRTKWDHAAIEDASRFVQASLQLGRVGPYQVQAAIAALHAQAPTFGVTDWPQIAALYTVLRRFSPSPASLVNHAVAVSFAQSPAAALAMLEPFMTSLGDYAPLHAARADFLDRHGDPASAADAWRRARALTDNPFWLTEIGDHLRSDDARVSTRKPVPTPDADSKDTP
jgi:RNA polymerase sigma-70 factor, ECF subfamily